ncbi:hypothetical protein KKA13_03860 [Patescibacteria group bacterium]|nr:hypothetical protein [Patescibacteria group bacterium]
MYLIIDNSIDDKISLHYSLNTKWVQRDFAVDEGMNILSSLQQVLDEEGEDLADLNGLGAVVGIGRFTATRVAVTAGNTLAYALKIPIIGITNIDYEDFSRKLKDVPIGQYVSAKYSGEANIGKKKI